LIVTSVNPITNVVVLSAPSRGDFARVGYALGTPLAEEQLNRKAREDFDLWGMLFGYRIRIES
jgi:hypothetical protein